MNASSPEIRGASFSLLFVRFLICAVAILPCAARANDALPGTRPLPAQFDLSARMVGGIDAFLTREIERSAETRKQHWNRDFSSPEAYEESISPNRERFRRIIGAVDARLPMSGLEYVSSTAISAKAGETDRFIAYAVRWPVFEGVYGEGLLLQPKGAPLAHVVALPDADQTPEMLAGLAPGIRPESQFARRLAENGCQVLVPTLVDRRDNWSGNARLNRFTNQAHREWIYRQAFEMGRHIIGYEVQKVLAAVDWMTAAYPGPDAPKIGVAGYGEGGLIAFYSAALDNRIQAALVSGYFSEREKVWEEPIYRNVFGLLREFGDAEIASLVMPRKLIIEHSVPPQVGGPPAPRPGRSGAAPGRIATPEFHEVEMEYFRAQALLPKNWRPAIQLLHGNEGIPIGPTANRALRELLGVLGIQPQTLHQSTEPLVELRKGFSADERQERQVLELQDHTQRLLRLSEHERAAFFWNKTRPTSAESWPKSVEDYKDLFWNEVIGRLPAPSIPANPRSRKIKETAQWTCHEVVLDVWPDVFAWGYLLLPKDLKPGERRPVIVCQHGLEGLPEDTINDDPESRAYKAYKAYAARLAERGFVVFAPHNPYRGRDDFRVLQRKANPLKASLFSVILGQHERILDWLAAQPFTDPQRIAFYGLSYGGKTAMRVPALLDRYCLSICSADFNEWILKNVTVDARYSYMFTGEYEMPEFNLGHTFNYAEMAALIAPRPFMVERGHDDGVAPDEWVAYEYAKVRRLYAKLGIPERTAIEFFNGPHTINGVGTYEFLHRHLNWPVK